ncbi:DUF397 domain-containing protein [Actinomadura madurae]|uniref:DUF397 domain-containing protein n=1 Tax=Actinomadura madurae TaxID=1993 RepID=UPI000D826FC3|nr:DUF397 domain-containing protein [Actinomadura madurae]SPT60366.1 Domain of uncharacterised function (DUF397) [Actinomadura madurae]
MNDVLRVHWRKSGYSDHAGGDCVEVADLASAIGVRDSKDPDGPRLTLSRQAWDALTIDIKSGARDLP